MIRISQTLFRNIILFSALVMGAHSLSAQTLEGDWNYRGFYAEANGGPQKRYEHNFDFGTFNFASTGGDNYRVTIVDNTGTENFDLTLTRSGNVYSGVIPTDEEPNSIQREEIRIILDGDLAYLSALTWSTSTEAGLAGQPFRSDVANYLLSRNDFPTQDASRWTGTYAYRLGGQLQVWNRPSREEAVDVTSVSLDANGAGGSATYQGSSVTYTTALAPDTLGLAGESASPIPGNVGSSQVAWDEARRYVMAVQVNDTEVVWLQTVSTFATFNTGTTDQYYVIVSTNAIAGRATRTVEIAPTISRHPADVSVLTGGEAFFSVDAAGAPAPTYEWQTSTDGGTSWDSLINFDTTNFSGATSATLVVKTGAATDGQQFRVVVSNSAGSLNSNAATLKILAAPTARLPNLSVRTTVESAQTLAVGFVMTGGSKPLLIRALGPLLADFGVSGAMTDPRIGFNDANGNELDANDDWDASLAPTFAELGAVAPEIGSKDAALQVDLSGLATVSVTGTEAGTVNVEVYDIGESNDSRLVNVSARNVVGTGDNILIAGFVVRGDDPKNLLIRAVGPELQNFGLTGTLNDPLLKIFDADGNLVAQNDNWSPSLAPSFTLTGAFELTNLSLDAALVISLPPGAYTAQVSGADGGTGQAIVEIYELP